VEYREGLEVGYRYYNIPLLLSSSSSSSSYDDNNNDIDTNSNSNAIPMIPVRYPFGYGLTYTEFEYRNLTIQIREDTPTHKRVGVSFELHNRGHTHTNTRFHQSVQEVIQVYIRPISSAVYRPYHELKEFCKVDVPWQDCRTVHLELPHRAFALYDIGRHAWIVEHQKKKRVPSNSTSKDDRGNVHANDNEEDDDDNECMELEVVEYEIQIGSSSRDIRLRQTIQFQTGHMASTLARESYPPKTTTIPTTNTNNNTNNNDSSSTTRSFLVEDDVFAKRFIGGAVGVVGGVGVGGNDTDKRSDSSTTSSTSTSRSRMDITTTNTSSSSSKNSSSIPLVQVITRNTLLVDASSLSWIGSLLLFISLKVAQLELHKDNSSSSSNESSPTTSSTSTTSSSSTTTTTTTKKRELRLIRANVENLPLRGLVLFSQGAFTFKWLDFLVCLMNGYYWKGIKSIFFSFQLFRSSEKKKKKRTNRSNK